MTDRDRLIELLRTVDNMRLMRKGFSECADYLLDNGVIVPPCKVGETVYEPQPLRNRIQEYEITTYKWNGHYWWFTWVLKDCKGIYTNVEGFSSHQIGKTVFLTKEEAERALKEREQNG